MEAEPVVGANQAMTRAQGRHKQVSREVTFAHLCPHAPARRYRPNGNLRRAIRSGERHLRKPASSSGYARISAIRLARTDPPRQASGRGRQIRPQPARGRRQTSGPQHPSAVRRFSPSPRFAQERPDAPAYEPLVGLHGLHCLQTVRRKSSHSPDMPLTKAS